MATLAGHKVAVLAAVLVVMIMLFAGIRPKATIQGERSSVNRVNQGGKMQKSGFTLIELLVAISIIGILVALTFTSYSGAQKQARDTERRSDLNQYRNALENYAASNDGLYPERKNRQNVQNSLCADLTGFLSSCPDDPGSFTYVYETEDVSGCDGGNPCATQYVLAVELETGDYWEVCSTGESGKTVCDSDDGIERDAVCSVGTTDIGACPAE